MSVLIGLSTRASGKDGFSVIEVMIALSVLAVGVWGLSSALLNSGKLVKGITQNSDAQNMVSIVALSLTDSAKCPLAIQDGSGNPVDLPSSVKIATPSLEGIPINISRIKVGSSILADVVKRPGSPVVTGISLKQIVQGNPDPLAISPYVMSLEFQINKEGSLGAQSIVRKIPISVTIRDSGAGNATITSCRTFGPEGAPSTLGTLIVPDCTAGQVLTKISGVLSCVSSSPVMSPADICTAGGGTYFLPPNGGCISNPAYNCVVPIAPAMLPAGWHFMRPADCGTLGGAHANEFLCRSDHNAQPGAENFGGSSWVNLSCSHI